MNNFQSIALLSAVSLLTACASGPNVAEKENSSEALQMVTSAGAYGIFRDSTVPKDQVGDVGLAGYLGSSLMGLSLGSLQTGFAIALMADSTFGWEYPNYIMYLDANEVKGKDKYQVCDIVTKKMTQSMPNDLSSLQEFTSVPLSESDRFTQSRYNGGSYQCVDGYKLANQDDSDYIVFFRRDEFLVGSNVIIKGVSEPFDSSSFSNELRSKMPSTNIVAVRFYFYNSYLTSLLSSDMNDEKFVNPDGLYTSPSIKLPPATFLSLPRKQYIADGQYLNMVSMVRDNDNAYLFVKPDNQAPQSMPLADYHEQLVKSYESIIAKQ